MSRIVKIVIYAVVLFLLYLWISSVAKSCNKPATSEDIESAPNEDEGYNSDEEIYDEYFESDGENKNSENEDDFIEQETNNPAVNDTEDEEIYDEDFSFEEDENLKPTKSTPTKSTYTNSSSSSSGKYIIVAGSYLIKSNADKMVAKLIDIGYTNAEVVNFDLSQYHTISAGQYTSYDAANQIARQIKNKGIDCYVHTRK